MKKIFFLSLLIAGAMVSNAQKPDLTIQLTDVVYSNNAWRVNYTIKNIGQSGIDLNTVTAQGNIQSVNGGCTDPAGGSVVSLVSNTLAPNASYQGSFGCGLTLQSGQQYKYSVTLRSNSPESNTDNNISNAKLIVAPVLATKGDMDYFLSGVTLTFHTGNDNKENNNSDLYVKLGSGKYYTLGNCSNGGYKPEFRVNSDVSVPLNRGNYASCDNSLFFYKHHDGIQIELLYNNRVFRTDAWKINSIDVKYEFSDASGNVYAAAGKTINFPVNNLLGYKAGDDILNNAKQTRYLILRTNQAITGTYPNQGIAVQLRSAEGKTCL